MRIGRIKRWDKLALLASLFFSLAALTASMVSLGNPAAGKWLITCGLSLTVAGLFQLEVSGLFETVMERFSDPKEFPYGPPSHIMREIAVDPDQSFRDKVESILFFRLRTGFWLIVVGTIAQIAGTWL